MQSRTACTRHIMYLNHWGQRLTKNLPTRNQWEWSPWWTSQPLGARVQWWSPKSQVLSTSVETWSHSMRVCWEKSTHCPKSTRTLAQLTKAKEFSKHDANSSFWQIPLSKLLRLLMTFIIPSGGTVSTNYHFIHQVPKNISKSKWTRFLLDWRVFSARWTVLWYLGKIERNNDIGLMVGTEMTCVSRSYTQPTKCEFGKTSLKFLGHFIDLTGINADPDKMQTRPSNSRDEATDYCVGTLPLHGHGKPTYNASSYGLEAVLLQKVESEWKSILYYDE